jgi:predicted acetyltransferase
VDALQAGWYSNSPQGPRFAVEELARIKADATAYLSSLIEIADLGQFVQLHDGRTLPRLSSMRFWIWDGEYCGFIRLRRWPGHDNLPPECLGHIGYAVVPAKRRKGYASQALAETLCIARSEGLASVELATDFENTASRRTIERNGGILVERFVKPGKSVGQGSVLYRISLAHGQSDT